MKKGNYRKQLPMRRLVKWVRRSPRLRESRTMF